MVWPNQKLGHIYTGREGSQEEEATPVSGVLNSLSMPDHPDLSCVYTQDMQDTQERSPLLSVTTPNMTRLWEATMVCNNTNGPAVVITKE